MRFVKLCAVVLFLGLAAVCRAELADYSKAENWAYCESAASDKQADVFFINPTTYFGTEEAPVMPMTDGKARENFVKAINMEKGIYDGNARFFAPFYRQIGLNLYGVSLAERQAYLEFAYRDVRDAFKYYMEHYNNGRPVILAGFSQGGELCLRLMKDRFCDTPLMKQLVACYAIGWRVYSSDLKAFADMKMAAGEDDTGVIIAYNSEAVEVQESFLVPKGVKLHAVNPLNWKSDSTPADKSLNKGACFTDGTGAIKKEIPAYTGAYIDPERGSLKVTDVNPDHYPSKLKLFHRGVYHLFDYMFFYRNLQDNVKVRINAFMKRQAA